MEIQCNSTWFNLVGALDVYRQVIRDKTEYFVLTR